MTAVREFQRSSKQSRVSLISLARIDGISDIFSGFVIKAAARDRLPGPIVGALTISEDFRRVPDSG